MMSGPRSPDVNPLDDQVWWQCWSLIKLQSKPKTVPEFKDAIQLIWSVLPEKAIVNAVKDYRKRLQTCVLASG